MLEIAVSAIYICFLIWVIGKYSFFRHDGIKNRTFQWLFLIKLLAAFALYIVYTKFYPDRKYADIFKYYDDSKVIFDSFFSQPYDFFRMLTGYHQNDADLKKYYDAMYTWFNSEMVFNDARTMTRLNVIFRFISCGCYFPHTIFFTFLAFAGLTALYKVAARQLINHETLLIIAVFLMPSILFWTSGVIKEALLVFSIGLSLYHIDRIIEKPKPSFINYVTASIFLFILLNIKSYVFFAILPALIAYLWFKKQHGNQLLKFAFIHIIYFVILYNAAPLIMHRSVPELLQSKQEEFYQLAYNENAGSTIKIPKLNPNLVSLLKNAPEAITVTLFRPHLFESRNYMMLLSALENTVILVLIGINIFFIIKGNRQNNITSLFCLSLFFTTITFCLIGWVTPVLGAVVRYKVAALPFLMIALFYNARWKGIESFLRKYFLKAV